MTVLNTDARVASITAYLIAFYVMDVSSQLIDVLTIPVPRMVMGVSWSTGLGIVALLILWARIRDRGVQLLGTGAVGLLVVILFWLSLEIIRPALGMSPDIAMIVACLPALFVSQLARIHLSVFGNRAVLINAYVYGVATITAVHLLLLLATKAGVSVPRVNIVELVDRNSLSMLLVVAVWLVGVEDESRPLFGRRVVMLAGYSAAHIMINNARGAAFILLLVLLLHAARKLRRGYAFSSLHYGMAAAVLMAVVIFSYPGLKQLSGFAWFGLGDATLSTQYRTQANWLLWTEYAWSPVLGIGWDRVFDVRSGGYISHTLYLMLLSAYGVVGVAPLLLWAGVWMSRISAVDRRRFAESLLFIVAATSFLNDIVIWIGLVLALVSPVGRRLVERSAYGVEAKV